MISSSEFGHFLEDTSSHSFLHNFRYTTGRKLSITLFPKRNRKTRQRNINVIENYSVQPSLGRGVGIGGPIRRYRRKEEE